MRTYKSQVGRVIQGTASLGDFLVSLTRLEPQVLEDAASKGAVWIQRNGKGKILRIRSLKDKVSPSDVVQFYFDPKVLSLPEVNHLEALHEDENYGVWIKPPGVVPQGSQTSDHASVLRYVEKVKKREVFLVHRLDRETTGPMLVAYHSKAAAYLSGLFQKNEIKKSYEAIVLGEMAIGHKETISASLDDKEAVTHLEVMDSKGNKSLLKIEIETGRLHQIRRHLDHIGHPVIGDSKYGKGNKNRDGLKLLAKSLSFQDPWAKALRIFTLNESLRL